MIHPASRELSLIVSDMPTEKIKSIVVNCGKLGINDCITTTHGLCQGTFTVVCSHYLSDAFNMIAVVRAVKLCIGHSHNSFEELSVLLGQHL